MKRHFSSGDLPKQINTLGTVGESSTLTNKLAKHEERMRIKGIIMISIYEMNFCGIPHDRLLVLVWSFQPF